jgi:hypothetical protein
MAATDITLFNDIVNRTLVTNLNNQTPFRFAPFYQAEKINIRLIPVTPTNGGSAPFFSKADISNLLPFLYVGPRAGATALLAAQEVWTAVPDPAASTGYFAATLDLNMTAMNTAIGTNDSISTLLEIHWSESGLRRIGFQTPITVNSTVYDIAGASVLPTPSASYPTWAEAKAVFVKWFNNDLADRGKTITVNSPDGTAWRIIGVNNDKSALDDLL